MRCVSWPTYFESLPAMKLTKSSAISRCSSSETRPTHGAAQRPMSPSRHGRFVWRARLNVLSEQDRIGNTFSRWSTVSRMAQTLV
ncbi:hypothetical protein CMMCA002_09505 [Clavibacter michiganensis subsp. michiganensis]|uniref:Uncharacterized protein n=1 Tax=Clavibacter michiganensis subsp. michiganensis TaxID=33013 RepID=A0A251XI43_CLAMM|nr:hypothetical protein BC477_13315 [Clavibacter michiganensis subsp. michiganensis]OUE02775.1 hypothetical protein CMMCAS07_12220 [Clavibacter michiganensis subsp. michiganensis]OUE16380.1 hypothetical protein CMMCA002_09505 [Clavibacter michiganensis subsp. michiganensis]